MYKDTKEDTVWSMDKFNDYLNKTISAEKGIEENWVYNILTVSSPKHIIYITVLSQPWEKVI